MQTYGRNIQGALSHYQEVFDVYYTDDAALAKEFFYLKLYPEFLPFIVVLDPTRQQVLRVPSSLGKKKGELIPVAEQQESGNDYLYKTFALVMPDKAETQLKKYID